jgi:ribosomal protein S18 acetylase RimI-like enzyme
MLIRSFDESDLAWAEELIGAFGGRLQARLGSLVDALACPGLVAEHDGERVGIVTFDVDDGDVEVVYLEVTKPRTNVGTALLDAVQRQTGARRLWLVTTNDNVDALRFYQRRGFRISEVHVGAVEASRRSLKPSLPETGHHGIPIRDEIVLTRA